MELFLRNYKFAFRYLRKQFKTHQEYLDFWYTDLDKIGMNSMVIETDMAGNYVGSSYGWATTRDWSKFYCIYIRQLERGTNFQ
jgi:hypothetical protein